jgi:hypothetical protein
VEAVGNQRAAWNLIILRTALGPSSITAAYCALDIVLANPWQELLPLQTRVHPLGPLRMVEAMRGT